MFHPMYLNEYQRDFVRGHISTLRRRAEEARRSEKEAPNDRLEFYYRGSAGVWESELQVWEFFVESMMSEDLFPQEDADANAA